MNQRRGGLLVKILIGIVIAGVLLVGGVSFLTYRGIQKAKQAMPGMMHAKIAELEKSKKVAPEDLAALRDLEQVAGRKEASLWGVTMASGIVQQFGQGNAITTGERKALVAVRDYMVSKKGNVGMRDMAEFSKNNPDAQAVFNQMQAEAKKRQGKP